MKSNRIVLGTIIAVVVIGGAIALGSAGHKSATPSSSTAPTTATNIVTIKNYMFGPDAITVKPGTTVTWTNTDAVSHTVTADTVTSDAPSSMDIAQGQSYSYTFKVAGTYTYHCFPHPYMHGTVIVAN